ncbi:hypothetical protein [Lishizhenia sp.]|uniref:hypothetical protein n=1 Tax=Lishizhenia sp. TaxID=2497594 RepID=UPI00299F39CA|nr:hypothetical protein [Lishizhenia sp.]MDX1446624.1 hypothetical protein [Lishizhenia sp.]
MGGIIEFSKLRQDVMKLYETGGGKTYYCGFKCLAPHYSIKEGGVTDWTGYPASGKTELLLEMLINCNKWYGHKHLIYMPDAGTAAEVAGKLMHKLSGKQFDEFFYNKRGEKIAINNRLSQAEVDRYLPEIHDSFKIFDPTTYKNKNTRSKSVTPKEYWDFAVQNKAELGIFGAVIDSWNYMHHDTKGFAREDKWLEDVLSYRNELAEQHNLHLHTIIHPTSAKRDKNGNIIAPDMHSLKGGSEWANNAKSVVVAHRDFGAEITTVKVAKAKPKIVGIAGECNLQYDLQKGKYFEIDFTDGGRNKYAERLENTRTQSTLSFN